MLVTLLGMVTLPPEPVYCVSVVPDILKPLVEVVVDVEAAGAVVAVDVDGAVVVVAGAVAGAAVSSRFLRPPSRLLSARCSCSAVAAIAVSNFAISSAEALPLFALSSSACIASIWAFNASISASPFLEHPIPAPMISAHAITVKSLLVIIYSLY